MLAGNGFFLYNDWKNKTGIKNVNTKNTAAMPFVYIFGVIVVCLAGIAIGSFFDYEISVALAHPDGLGDIIAKISPVPAYALMPLGWGCIYTGLKKKLNSSGKSAGIPLVFAVCIAIALSGGYYGGIVNLLLGYVISDQMIRTIASWLFWVILYALITLVMPRFLDDSKPKKLIAVGLALWASTIASDIAAQWLKHIAYRPRYRYLLTLEDPLAGYRNWWEMVPNLAGSDESFQSWPSGHMSIIGVLIALPLLAECLKKRSIRISVIVFALVCIYFIAACYNRIQMAAHFLSDVCFGTMDSCLITTGICAVLLKLFKAEREE